MPPKVALAIVVGFTLYLLAWDRKQSREVSWTAWLPTLWVLYLGSRPISRWFVLGEAGGGSDDGSPMDRIFLSFLILIALMILASRKLQWSVIMREQRWLFALVLFAGISCLWSAEPYIALKRWVRVLGCLLIALVIATESSPEEALLAVFRRTAYILVPLSVVLIKYFGDYGRDYDRWAGKTMWVGVSTQKNSLGILCSMSALFLIWSFARRWTRKELKWFSRPTMAELLVFGCTLWILRGPEQSYSATAALGLMAGLFIYFALTRMARRGNPLSPKLIMAVAFIMVLFGMAVPLSGGGQLFSGLFSMFGRDITFTGRTDIWAKVLPFAWQHPFLGTGYGSFWLNPPLPPPFNTLTHAHNGYLDVFLQLGAVGVVLVIVCVLGFFSNAIAGYARNPEWGAFAIALLFVLLLHDITEVSFIRASYLWTIIGLFAVLLPGLKEPEDNVVSDWYEPEDPVKPEAGFPTSA